MQTTVTVELNGQSFSGVLSSISLGEIAALVQGSTVDELLAAVAGDCHAITVTVTVTFHQGQEKEFSFLWADLEDEFDRVSLDEDGIKRFAKALLEGLELPVAVLCGEHGAAKNLLDLGFSVNVLKSNVDEISAIIDEMAGADDFDKAIKVLVADQDNLDFAEALEACEQIGGEEFACLLDAEGDAAYVCTLVEEGCFEGEHNSVADFAEYIYCEIYENDTPKPIRCYIDFVRFGHDLMINDYTYADFGGKILVWRQL